jgi:hypothetical protein
MLVLAPPERGSLAAIPPDRYVNGALLLQTLAYLCYSAGYSGRRKITRSGLLPARLESAYTATAFIIIGGLGLALEFPSIADLVTYYSGQADVTPQPGPATLSEAASQFLRPFLPYGILILWASRVSRRRPGAPVQVAELGLAATAVILSATNTYNRGSIEVPILALITAFSYFGRRQNATRIGLIVAILTLGAFLFGQWRADYMNAQVGQLRPGGSDSLTGTLQTYGNGPQFWAVALQDVDNSGLRNGTTLVGSAMLPVPVIGKPFRDQSGTTLYNQLIYQKKGNQDQNLGFGAELYWNFGITGVVIGYLLFGCAVRWLDDKAASAIDPLAAYSWCYCGIWVALLEVNSVAVLAQILVYFCWPILAMWLLTRRAVQQRVEVG